MKKALKIIGITLGALVLLVIAAAITLPFIIDPNDFKPQIEAEVKKQTGRELSLKGDLGLSIFPWIGVTLGRTELGNAPGFGETAFAVFDNAAVKVKLMPLLSKQVEVQEITLEGVEAHLVQRADGRTNWDDLAGKPADAPVTPGAGMSIDVVVRALVLDDIQVTVDNLLGDPRNRVGRVELSNSKVTMRDDSGATRQLDNVNLTVNDVLLAGITAVPVSLAFDVALSEPPLKAHVALDTKLGFDQATQDVKLSALTIETDYQLNAPFVRGKTTLNADVDFSNSKQRLLVSGLKIVNDVELPDEKIKVPNTLTGQVDFALDSQQLKVEPLELQATAFVPQLPPEGVPLNVTTNVQADLKAQTLTIPNLTIDAAGAALQASVDGKKIIDDPQFAGTLKLAALNIREWLPKVGQPVPETADKTVLRHIDLNSSFRASTKDAGVDSLIVKLDDTQVKASASLANFAAPAIRFKVAVDAINVDRYLPPPPPEGKEGAAATPATAAAAGAGELPLETLRGLDVKGNATIGKLIAAKATVTDVDVSVDAKDGLIVLHPLKAKLYEGSYAGNLKLDARGDNLQISMDEALTGISAGPLLKDVIGEDRLSGKGNLTMKLTAAGSTPEWITRTLSGNVGLSFKDGAVKGINVGRMTREVRAKLRNEKVAATSEVEKTDFSELTATLQIDKGVARNRDLSVKSPLLRVEGNGSADLPNSQLDYLITATVVGTSKGQEGRELEELKGLPIPVRITGPFANLKFDIQYDEILKARAKAALDKEKAKQKEKVEEKKQELKQELKQEEKELKEKAEEKLKEKFKGLLGR